MIYLIIWSCGMVLLMLCPYVSSQQATPAAIISTSVNQSLSFGAVSKESPTTILTKLTSSMSVSLGDGYLGSSSVNMSQIRQQAFSVENTITNATSIQDTWGLGTGVPITNTMNPELDQFIRKMPTVTSEPFTLTSKSPVETFATKMDDLSTWHQMSTQTLTTDADGYNDIFPGKLSGSIWMSAVSSDSGNILSSQLPDYFTSAASSHSSSPSSVIVNDEMSLMPSSAWKDSSVIDTSAYGGSSSNLPTPHLFPSSPSESIYTESVLNWITISSMYASEETLYTGVPSNRTSSNQLNSTEFGIETFVMSATPVYDASPSLSPSFLETSIVESGNDATTSSVIGALFYSDLSEADFSDISHSLPLTSSFTPSLETSTVNATLALINTQSFTEWNSTNLDTAFWQINTTVMAHTSSILDQEYDTAGSVNLSTIGVTTVEVSPAEGATMVESTTVYATVIPVHSQSSSVVSLSSSSTNTVEYPSSSVLPSSTQDTHTVSSMESLQPSKIGYSTEPVLTQSLPATPSITPSPLSVSVIASDWLGNGTTDSSTNLLNYTDIQATTLKPTSEWVLNTSDAFAPYWVKTVIKVPPSEDEQSVSFRREMETKLAGILSEALQRLSSILSGTYKPLRRRRAVTMSNATVQITNISRDNPVETSHTALVYYMIEGDPAGSITSADRTAGLMQLFSEQELAIKFGYEVVVKAEVYVRPPPAKDKRLWIIGAVLGGLAGLVILVWCFLFVYFKCTRPPTKLPSQRSPHMAKVADIDQIDYKGRDVKGFDYARTEVGLESELDRQNVPDYYRRYPMGSTDLEGMYSPGETPPPPFRGHHPSSGSSKRGAKGEPSYPPPAPPSNGFIHPISNKENQAKPDKKSRSDEVCSTDTEDTQGSRGSEDRKPLSSKKGRVPQKQRHKRTGHQPDQFEHVSKMGRVEDPEMLMPPTRTTIHAIKSPVLESRPQDDNLPEIPPDKDINETLQQKAEIERWRNKQRQREKSEQRRAQKHGQTKESSSRHHLKDDENNEKIQQNGVQPNKPKRKKKKPKRMPVSEQVPVQDNIEMKPVYDHKVIQPVIAGMQQAPLPCLESDSSDDGLEPATGTRDREMVNALLDEAFAMVTPTPTINPPEEPQHPAPQLTKVVPVHQPPVYVSPVSTQTTKPTTTWNPYEAGDQVAYLVPPGQIVTPGSRSPSLRDTDARGSHISPRSTHQYTNPAYMADLPANIGSQPIRSTDINDSSTPRYGSNAANGFVPNSPCAFSPYKKPAWTDLMPTAWDDPDKTLPVANRFGERQSGRIDKDQARTQSDNNSFSRFHVPKPTRREDADDEIDIINDVMKSGTSAQPLIASIREEIERLAKRSQDNRSQHIPVT